MNETLARHAQTVQREWGGPAPHGRYDTASALRSINIVLGSVTKDRDIRLAICSRLFGRTITSTKELMPFEMLAFIRAAYLWDRGNLTFEPDLEFVSELIDLKEQVIHEQTAKGLQQPAGA